MDKNQSSMADAVSITADGAASLSFTMLQGSDVLSLENIEDQQLCILQINASGVETTTPITITVQYDAAILTHITNQKNEVMNAVVTEDIPRAEIISENQGVLTLRWTPLTNNNWSGVVAALIFKASVDAQAEFQDYVCLNTGALIYTNQDITVPGKDGFDLVISRTYNSNLAATELPYPSMASMRTYFRNIYYTRDNKLARLLCYYKSSSALHDQCRSYDDTNTYLLGPVSTAYSTVNTLTASPAYLNLYNLGFGWQFDFPYLQQVPESGYNGRDAYRLYLGDGHFINIDYDPNARAYICKPNPLAGAQIELLGVFNCKIHYKDGKTAVFASGRLSFIEDQKQNRISFQYSGSALSKITDTYGRVLLLEQTAVPGGKELCWKWQDSGEILYRYMVLNNELTEATPADPALTTTYQYARQQATTCHLRDSSAGTTATIDYVNLTEIAYPQGHKSQFSYAYIDSRFSYGMEGRHVYFAIEKSVDIMEIQGVQARINEKVYRFQVGEQTLSEYMQDTYGREAYGLPYIRSAEVSSHPAGTQYMEKQIYNFSRDNTFLESIQSYDWNNGKYELRNNQSIDSEDQYTFIHTNKVVLGQQNTQVKMGYSE